MTGTVNGEPSAALSKAAQSTEAKMKRQIHLNLFIYARGHHEAAWRHPQAPDRSLMDIQHDIECARKAEAACFDSVFLADVLNLPPDADVSARIWL